jgi:hypothetical protein
MRSGISAEDDPRNIAGGQTAFNQYFELITEADNYAVDIRNAHLYN